MSAAKMSMKNDLIVKFLKDTLQTTQELIRTAAVLGQQERLNRLYSEKNNLESRIRCMIRHGREYL